MHARRTVLEEAAAPAVAPLAGWPAATTTTLSGPFAARAFGRVAAAAWAAAAAVAAAAALTSPAFAQGRLTAQYRISVAGIPIGRGDFTAEIFADRYVAAGSGSAAGFLRILVSGEGTVTARGVVSNGRLAATEFTATLDEDDDHSTAKMSFDNGTVKDLVSESSAPAEDRIPLTEAHRHGVIDPVSAMLVPAGEALSPAPCQRTLPIFDGRRRYDLRLSFKRMDNVKTDKGYRGAVVVCAAEFRPIAGHRVDSTLVKYLSDGRDLELWLAPIAGTTLLGPYRLSVANLIGSLAIEAMRYESVRLPAGEAAAVPAPSP